MLARLSRRRARSPASSRCRVRRIGGRLSSPATQVSSSCPAAATTTNSCVVAHLPHWEGLVHLVARARRIANLDFDLDEPAAHLSDDPTLGPLLRARPGLRTPGVWDPFEAGVRAVIGQQISVAAANTITGRLVARFGTPVPGLLQLGLTHAFPSAPDAYQCRPRGSRTSARSARVDSLVRPRRCRRPIRLDGSVGLDDLIDSLTAIGGLGSMDRELPCPPAW